MPNRLFKFLATDMQPALGNVIHTTSIYLTCLILSFSLLMTVTAKADDEKFLFLGNHDIPPMIYLTQNGPAGVVIDLAKAIIDKAGLNAKVDAIDWSDAQQKLKTGAADALLQINSNPEREKIFDFSEPLLLSEFSIFRKSDRIDLQNITSLYGRSVGVEKKGYPYSILKKHPKIKIVIIPSWVSGFHKISKGEIDAVIVDRWVGEFELSKLNITNVVVNKKPVETGYSTIAVRKGNNNLLAAINDGIKQIRADGTYDRILANWQSQEVIHLTRGQWLNYITRFLFVLLIILIIGGLFYVRRIRIDNHLKAELNQRLEMRNNELLEFAYRTSHDLKSPLTSSKQLLRYITKDIDAGKLSEAKRNAHAIENLMGKLENLIASVLDMASADFKEQEVELINFPDMLQDIKARLSLSLNEKTCSVILSDKTTQPIHLSRARLGQVIENLISNGIKYRDQNKPNPFVKVSTTNDLNFLSITIEDNGLGIPEKYQERVFDMFQRFHPEVNEGTGLGMNIVRKHIDILGGTINFTSTENKGTRFEIQIPLIDIERQHKVA